MFQWNPASLALYEPADIRPGHIVADFGCGLGHTAIEIAKWGLSHKLRIDVQRMHMTAWACPEKCERGRS
jgi:hypothetical protein